MMAGAGQLDSPTCAEVTASSNSPRFDITEFLKTSKDVAEDQQLVNFATTFNSTTAPQEPRNRSRGESVAGGPPLADQADFSTLLATIDATNPPPPPAYPGSDTLIALDDIDADIAKDSFALFGHPDLFAGPPLFVPVPPASVPSRLPYIAGPAGYMTEEDVGLDERAYGSMEHGASTSGGARVAVMGCGGAQRVDWGVAGAVPAPQFGLAHQQQQFHCASCQILRRIIHSNGVQDTKLEIHGCNGQSYHAVLQTRFCIDDSFPASFEQQMVEFPVGNAEYVKQFLLQYSLLRRKEGFVLRHDSVASHGSGGLGMAMSSERVMGGNAGCMPKQMGHMVLPDVLCTSSDFSDSGCAYGKAGLGQNKVHRSGSIESTDNADTTIGPAKPPKSNAAAQRERTGKLKMTDLAQHFHLPINAAAKELGICPTVLKKICRRNGMRRWPHRKIKSIERIIATLEQTIAEGVGQGDEGIRMEIAMLRNERAQLCAGFLGES